ncbi:MAG: hypothetical protein ACK5P7_09220 [Bdellovibrio sp.]|jgi:hypothetical protein
MSAGISSLVAVAILASTQFSWAQVEPAEIACTIRETGSSLNCQWISKGERKSMTSEDISTFIDQSSVMAYMTVKSRRGLERTFMVDGNAPQFRKLAEMKKTASISEVSRTKNDLFSEMEKRAIKVSDDLDAAAVGAELVKFDPSISTDKFRRETRNMVTELEGFKKNRDKVCTATPAFEQMSKANAGLQQSLSNILFAFQTPDSCMSGFKVFKDKDGSVDLRQLDGVADQFKANCKKR